MQDKLISCEVKPSTKISALRNALRVRESSTPEDTCFFVAGKEIDMKKTACDLNMKNKNVVLVLSRSFLNPTHKSLKRKMLEKCASAKPSTQEDAPGPEIATVNEPLIDGVSNNVTCFL
jgi:hypothetical protein